MEEVKITRNYQTTIPADIRDKLGIKIGDRILVYIDKDRIIMEKPKGDITKISIKLDKNIDAEYVEKVIREAGDEIGRSSL
ncbi:VapB-type antitoxin [Ferroplasma acidiphilum]|jgi:AbrB family looped-hinge helix DNA binding protein|uniref:VapB-type antitoxin n=1 Tax=Ferroplasma acidiphilum TaxID=74969 RepID=A0A1V0N436_9ARCH|nr:AbrB/MazE/SpoVT family DNA-binding domain-containing protein [Ferroplasma acidiphilum]ARD84874.1 VapB-type antitoxin [Ferroplasma acidiphilum]